MNRSVLIELPGSPEPPVQVEMPSYATTFECPNCQHMIRTIPGAWCVHCHARVLAVDCGAES